MSPSRSSNEPSGGADSLGASTATSVSSVTIPPGSARSAPTATVAVLGPVVGGPAGTRCGPGRGDGGAVAGGPPGRGGGGGGPGRAWAPGGGPRGGRGFLGAPPGPWGPPRGV